MPAWTVPCLTVCGTIVEMPVCNKLTQLETDCWATVSPVNNVYFSPCFILYCSLFCTVLFLVLYCTVPSLFYTVLFLVLYCTVPCFILYCSLFCTVLFLVLHCTVPSLFYTVLFLVLYCTVPCFMPCCSYTVLFLVKHLVFLVYRRADDLPSSSSSTSSS